MTKFIEDSEVRVETKHKVDGSSTPTVVYSVNENFEMNGTPFIKSQKILKKYQYSLDKIIVNSNS